MIFINCNGVDLCALCRTGRHQPAVNDKDKIWDNFINPLWNCIICHKTYN